jgi:hypothetical protein
VGVSTSVLQDRPPSRRQTQNCVGAHTRGFDNFVSRFGQSCLPIRTKGGTGQTFQTGRVEEGGGSDLTLQKLRDTHTGPLWHPTPKRNQQTGA